MKSRPRLGKAFKLKLLPKEKKLPWVEMEGGCASTCMGTTAQRRSWKFLKECLPCALPTLARIVTVVVYRTEILQPVFTKKP